MIGAVSLSPYQPWRFYMKTIFAIFFVPAILVAFIENLQYEDTIARCAIYDATLLENNGKLYVDAKGAIEEYEILANGNLELISYIHKTHYTLANAKIIDDMYYVGNNPSAYDSYTDIYRIDISGDQMQLIDIQTIDTGYGLFRFDVNDDYFIYVNSSEIDARVLNRETFEYVTSIEAGGFFEVKDSLLFRGMTNGNLSIMDISDIENPVEISTVYIGDYEQNVTYYFHENYLFIGQNTRIAIIDIADIENPHLVTNITDIPTLSPVNHFTDIEIYENYLIFKNSSSTIWIYDINDIYEPLLVVINTNYQSETTNRESMIRNGEELFISTTSSNIMHFCVDQLPTLQIINSFGNNGHFHFFDYKYPYILFSNMLSYHFNYFKVTEPNAEINTLYDSGVYTYCFNDTIMCFIDAVSNNNSELVICAYNDEEIVIRNSLNLGYAGRSVEFVGEHLVITQKNPGIVKINDLLDNYTIQELAEHQVELRPFVAPSTSYCSDNYIYIVSKNYDLGISYLNIYENFGDFSEVSNSHLNIFGNSFNYLYRLSDNRSILSGGPNYSYEYDLFEYTFPDSFELLDNFTTDGSIKLHDDFFVCSKGYLVGTDIYSWQNDEFEEIFSYDFGCEISDIFIIPNTNILYAVGRYTVLKYSFEYTGIDINIIPIQNVFLTNHPNPFNPSTEIRFQMSEVGEVESIEIAIYNIKGQKIRTLECIDRVDAKTTESFSHSITWNGRDDNDKPVSSGVYFYQLKADGKPIASKKMLLVK